MESYDFEVTYHAILFPRVGHLLVIMDFEHRDEGLFLFGFVDVFLFILFLLFKGFALR